MSSRDQKKQVNRIAEFLKKYASKKRKCGDANDRAIDHKIQHLVKRMKPEEMDRLLREEGIKEENEDQSKVP